MIFTFTEVLNQQKIKLLQGKKGVKIELCKNVTNSSKKLPHKVRKHSNNKTFLKVNKINNFSKEMHFHTEFEMNEKRRKIERLHDLKCKYCASLKSVRKNAK